jgi:CheY-like chemotaxis protein/two-component sensor histidine kinase
MVRLTDDLLDVSRMTHGTLGLHTERTSLRSLLNQAIDAAHPWSDRKQHTVELDAPDDSIEVEGDAVRLVQVFTNMLSNACKYTDPGGRIGVRVARDGDAAIVEIRDSGVGIPHDKLDSIFEMFARLDSAGRSEGGLGIGLTLSRRLVEMHGGTMIAASEGPGRGSQFTVRLPAIHAARPEHSSQLVATDGLQGASRARRVLIVDDNVDAAESLAILLSAEGHVIQTAYDGKAALREVATFRPEVLLLDLGLPDIDGTDVCKAIRTEPGGQQLLVIALSGWGQERDKRRTAEAGFDAHLTKPADLGELTTLIAQL